MSGDGYTLLEILVSLTVIGLLFSLGFVNFRDFSRRQALLGVARSVKGEIRLTQERALSGRKPADPSCNSPNTLDGYNFRVVSANNYTIEASCTGGTVSVKSVDLPPDVSISTPSPNPILFKVLGQGTNIPAEATLTLTQAETGNTQVITIGAGGEVK